MLNIVPEARLTDGGRNHWVERICPDLRAARRVVSEARRIERVEVVRTADGATSATVTGVWHRLPVTRAVPVATAIGLSVYGVRTLVDGRVHEPREGVA
jgi:hypothetical protein